MKTETKPNQNIRGAEAIMECLVAEGVSVIYGYPGGAIMPFYDALYDYSDKVHHVLVRHEQAAAHAAQGYAQISKNVGVCVATSGPGATNLVTGIADAMLDSIPIVCITGQVAREVVGTDAFQEVDMVGITTPITKWNYQITSAEEIPLVFAKAFKIARTGRPGPVLIDITKNAQFEMVDFHYPKEIKIKTYQVNREPDENKLIKAAALINNAKKPFMFIGHGIKIAAAEAAAKAICSKANIPVASTLLGLSAISNDFPEMVGFLGMHGNYAPNVLTNQADVIIAVGMRFDDRVTSRLAKYAKQAKIIHIDIDPAEHNKNVKVDVAVAGDARLALEELLPLIEKANHKNWLAEFTKLNKIEEKEVISKAIAENSDESAEPRMSQIITELSKQTKNGTIIVTDVGQHQMETARYYKFEENDSFVTSGGAGTMGYGVPTAMGCQMADPKRDIVVVVGDGGIQMTIQEFATIVQEKLPIKIMLLNNSFLGMVRQWQQLFFEKRYSFTNMHNPDFIMVAKGYGIPGKQVTTFAQAKKGIAEMLAAKGPYLLEVKVQQETNVFPMIPTGAGVDEVRLN